MTRFGTTARIVALAAPILLAAVTAASAHTGQAPHLHGFFDGFAHPLLGADHLAAMLAVGFWAASLGGRAVVAVPAAFVVLLALGGALGAEGVSLPAVEPVITASVVVLGLLVALAVRLPVVPAALLVGAFGLFHGFAHGAEMPAAAAPLAYGLGFVIATVLLHTAGIGLWTALAWRAPVAVVRLAGACVAGAGVLLALA